MLFSRMKHDRIMQLAPVAQLDRATAFKVVMLVTNKEPLQGNKNLQSGLHYIGEPLTACFN